jgi:hypothetical protein
MMKEEDLKFWNVVEAQKPHWIFKQGARYFVMTDIEEESRGNFISVEQSEVNRVRKDLTHGAIHATFHCDEIAHLIHGLRGGAKLRLENRDYFISRLRSVCYILKAEGVLGIRKEGRKFYFFKRAGL